MKSIKSTVKKLMNLHKAPIRLNVGCGTDYKKGWINIDNNSDDNIEKLDLNWDLRNPLPFDDNSVDYIFNEHFVEHLTVEEAAAVINDLMRVLRPGGVLRIAMPDLEVSVAIYNDKKWKSNRKQYLQSRGMEFVQTRAELLNMAFSWWGHKWLYDWEELERRLRDIGLKKIKRCEWGKSSYKELCGLETRDGSLLIAEVTK